MKFILDRGSIRSKIDFDEAMLEFLVIISTPCVSSKVRASDHEVAVTSPH